MGKHFGTDGIRGRTNNMLTLDMAVKIGQYLEWYYGKNCHAKILIGKDTRLSNDMFEVGLAAGATSYRTGVYPLGICPTPAVFCLIQKKHSDCGIMVSASHSPLHDNGIKLFNGDGCKMNPEIELEAKEYIDNEVSIEVAHNEKIRSTIEWGESLELYESWLKETVPMDLSGMNILLNLISGNAASCATKTLSGLGATVEAIHSAPNGININTRCGSTYLEELQSVTKEGNYHVGFVFDGDADRLIAIGGGGDLTDSDHTMYICGRYMRGKGVLHGDVVVTTMMSNLGLYHTLKVKGLRYEQTTVGDKCVFECMKEHDYSIDGEQSGRIIFHAHANTGDSLLAVMKLPETTADAKKFLKELCADLFIYPQLLINTSIRDKHATLEDKELLVTVDTVTQELGDEGRILVRPSRTEPLVRVMVEAKTDALRAGYADRTADFTKKKEL